MIPLRKLGSLLLLVPVCCTTIPVVHASATATARETSTEEVVSALGDPHFQTWTGRKYDFHGSQCDLVLLHSSKFAAGRGLDIHIRTSSSSSESTKEDAMFSYISGVALRIGQDVLQVSSHGTYYLNGAIGRHGDDEVLAGSPIVHRKLENDRYFYDITVESSDSSEPVILRLTSYQDICGVRILGGLSKNRDDYFGDSVGLLGRYESASMAVGEEMMARDGRTVLTNDPDSFGLEWQVRSGAAGKDNALVDPQLFQPNDAFPQYPQTCIMSPPTGSVPTTVTADDARHVRRRATSLQTQRRQAMEACAGKGTHVQECMFDVLKTGDITMAHAY